MKKKIYKDPVLQEAYEAGVDYAKNGVNQINCHFGIFSSKEKLEAWTKGSKSLTPPSVMGDKMR